MKFGDKLQALREGKGLTQAELAEFLSVNEANIYFFEKDMRPPTYKLLNKIAKYFNVKTEYLIGHKDIDKTVFGNRLRELRKDKLLNQPELSGVINVSPSNISYYEQGKSFPSVETLYIIADFFDVSIDYLLGRTDRKEIIFSKDEELQTIGEQYIELHKKLQSMGLTPKKTLEIIKALYESGLINRKL
ncbi:MAG: helix-turn-helix domain-containing protein [Maledivibacter sp.]|jgi:transcriptional regulator with XRE-family HTH domain|nr:helix-turn-helix domain-containing protein [Maledivibacter sp.]